MEKETFDENKTETSQKPHESSENGGLEATSESKEDSSTVLSDEEKALIKSSEPHEEEKEKIKKMGRHNYAVALIEEAKRLVHHADTQMNDCRLLLSEDLQSYEDTKAHLKREALEETESFLEELGYDWKEQAEEFQEPEVAFEAKEKVAPMHIEDISSGKFGSFIIALLSGLATSGAVMYAAMLKNGQSMDLHQWQDIQVWKSALQSVAQSVGLGEDLFIGGGITVLAGLTVYGIVYAMRTGGKAKKNLALAKQKLEEAQRYHTQKWDCKQEMDKVDAHIKDAIDTLRLYEVLLIEQNGKLRRIAYIEGEKDDINDYHKDSIATIRETGSLVQAIKEFMATPMADEGKLSGKSTLFLHRAKERAQGLLDKIYG